MTTPDLEKFQGPDLEKFQGLDLEKFHRGKGLVKLPWQIGSDHATIFEELIGFLSY